MKLKAMKLKTLAVALAMLGAGAAQASIISTDGFDQQVGIFTGTGIGDLFFVMFDPSQNKSLTLDLNLTANDFRYNNAAQINSFSVTVPLLATFIAASSDTSQLQWNLGGLSNKGTGVDLGILTTHGDAGATWDANEIPTDGNSMFSGMASVESFLRQNSDPNPNPVIVGTLTPAGWSGGGWGGKYAGALFPNNYHVGLAGGELMTFINADGNDPFDGLLTATAFTAGQWVVDGALGKVSYVSTAPVPVPAAVWLLGSGLLGLVGVARRRS